MRDHHGRIDSAEARRMAQLPRKPARKMLIACVVCHRGALRRADALYCGTSCKLKAYRERVRAKAQDGGRT